MEPQFTLKFVDHKIDGKTVWYTVQVKERGTDKTWQFPSRFSQLLDIHTASYARFPKGELPDFPPKKMFGNTNPEFVVRRKKELENYYNTLLRSIEIAKLPELRKLIEENRPKTVYEKLPEPKPMPGPNKPIEPTPEVNIRNRFEYIFSETVTKFIDISNIFFVPPDEGMIRRKKAAFDKVRIEMRSRLLPTLAYPKGCAENYGEFWATNYFEEREDFVKHTADILKPIRLKEILREEGLSETVVRPT